MRPRRRRWRKSREWRGVVVSLGSGLALSACGGLLGVDFSDARPYPDGGVAVNPCGTACSNGQFCLSGLCVESCGGLTPCSGVCVETASDAANCGTCGHACQGGTCSFGACSSMPSQPTTLASAQATPIAIAVDATSVYWVNEVGGSVVKVAKSGGMPVTLVPSSLAMPTAIAVDAANVYWANGSTLMQVSTAGGAPTMLASGQNAIGGIATDGTEVYWSTLGGPADHDGTIAAVPVGGGTVRTLASGLDEPCGVAASDASLYWTNKSFEDSNGSIGTVPKTGEAR